MKFVSTDVQMVELHPDLGDHPIVIYSVLCRICEYDGEGHSVRSGQNTGGGFFGKESFAKAAENAVAEAAKTVRGLKWARVAELEMELEGTQIIQYRAPTKMYFDVEQ